MSTNVEDPHTARPLPAPQMEVDLGPDGKKVEPLRLLYRALGYDDDKFHLGSYIVLKLEGAVKMAWADLQKQNFSPCYKNWQQLTVAGRSETANAVFKQSLKKIMEDLKEEEFHSIIFSLAY